jgi:hypothetical protein
VYVSTPFVSFFLIGKGSSTPISGTYLSPMHVYTSGGFVHYHLTSGGFVHYRFQYVVPHELCICLINHLKLAEQTKKKHQLNKLGQNYVLRVYSRGQKQMEIIKTCLEGQFLEVVPLKIILCIC